MTDFQNKIVFITGAASGIGLALTKAFLARGAKVMMADINTANLKIEADKLLATGASIATCVCDVRDPKSVQAAADATIEEFGKVHVVCNNAGVGLAGATGKVALEDWRWIVDINLMGVVYGVEIFTPLIKSHGEGGHIVNTASMAGHATMSMLGPYNATKFAVVGYSEALAQELNPQNIHVTMLCPTWVKSNIADSSQNKPTGVKQAEKANAVYQATKALVDNGMEADLYAALTVEAVSRNQLYVFNDAEARAAIDERRDHIQDDFDASLEILEGLTQ